MMKMTALLGATALTALAALPASAGEKWDMPLAYAATNFHSDNAAQFASCVGAATSGNLEVVTHPSGSLFAGNDIKRAVQTGQALIGEINARIIAVSCPLRRWARKHGLPALRHAHLFVLCQQFK